MSFENEIQQWVIIDNQIKQYNEKIRELRDKRNKLEINLLEYASTNNLSNIQISDGRLKFINSKVTTPLTFKYLEKSLGEIIKNNDQLSIIINHLKKNREVKYLFEIKRFSNN